MSDQQKPRLEIKFAGVQTIVAKVVDIDNGPKLRDEVALSFGQNGEVSTLNGCEMSFEIRYDAGNDVHQKLVNILEADVKRQSQQN